MTQASARHILVDNEAQCLKLKADIESGADFAAIESWGTTNDSHVGIYVRDDSTTYGQAIGAIAASIGAWVGFDRWGELRGAIVVDYFQIPDGPVAAGWPRVVANDWRLQRLVYHHTRDFMRRVSAHVTIGAAFREESALDHYFILCREPG